MRTTLLSLILSVLVAGAANAAPPERYKAHLDGFNAAGVAVDTNATGVAKFEVIDDGTAVRYSIKVAGIENLWMAHIHVSPVPVTVMDPAGPIAFWFAPTRASAGPPTGVSVAERIQGDFASGIIYSDADLVGVLAPDPNNPDGTGVGGLINAMRDGRASVVVHTNAFGDPAFPLGAAGNSPPGEIRGTIE